MWRDVIYKGNDNYYLESACTTGAAPAAGGTFGAANTNVYGRAVLFVGVWTHLAATYDGATLRLFVNGKQVSSTARTGSLVTSTNPLQIGGDSLYGQYFRGTIDEVRIYNVALTPAQIQSDLNTPITNPPGAELMTSEAAIERRTATTRPVPAAHQSVRESVSADNAVSALSCSPKAVTAGGQVRCVLQTRTNSNGAQIRLASSSEQVKTPSAVTTRPDQASLTFVASVEPIAKQQSATLTATLGDSRVQDSIVVMPGSGPVVKAPSYLLAAWGVPVGFTVIAVDPDDIPVQLAAGKLPAGASFDAARGTFTWTPSASQQGEYMITFTASNSARQFTSAETTVVVDSGKPALTAPQPLNCSPNAIASVHGKWLTAADTLLSEPSGGALESRGIAVLINGQAAPVLFSSATKVGFLCPALDPGAQLSLVVKTPKGPTEALTGTMLAASPAIFSLDGSGQGQGMVSFSDTGELAMERSYLTAGHPAQPGDEVVIWATGLGWAGVMPSGVLMVKIGGAYAVPLSVQPVSGRAGLSAIHVLVPEPAPAGAAVSVQLELLSPDSQQVSSNTVTAAFESIR